MKNIFSLIIGVMVTILATVAISADHLEDAVASDLRPAADMKRDALRKPAEVLRFFEVEPGSAALDLFSGAGYYTEILSRVVGPEGRVTAHNNNAFLEIIRDIDERFENNRLSNVTRVTAEPPEIPLGSNQFDFALMALAYHDFFIKTQDWPEFDVPQMLSILFDSIKPGGIVGIVDHVSAPGSGAAVAKRLHRIEPAFVIRQMEGAGFVLEASSDLLANPADPHDIPMWDPKIRSRTDRFVLKFRKPS